eukprot:TRINITY_DN8670_c0_g1_i1.p1 TRINITY_DN8670_c0_g1~~TRINITY_DN8670_c0_g1_i1.p1  ORF type:complete len:233 (+),score=42.95 TRINITY_DN8670_c0_g1_i1:23-700(+)
MALQLRKLPWRVPALALLGLVLGANAQFVVRFFWMAQEYVRALLFQPRLGSVGEAVRQSRRVTPNDLDAFGHMNNARYLTNMDFARLVWFLRAGWTEKISRPRLGYFRVIGSSVIKYRRELRPFVEYELETECVHYCSRYFYMLQTFRSPRNRDEIYATALVKYVFLRRDRATGTRERVDPREILRVLGLAGFSEERLQHPPSEVARLIESFGQSERKLPPEASK